MVKKKNKKIINQIIYAIGISIVFLTHIAMLILGGLPENQMMGHAIINLIAGSMIAYSYITK